MRVSRALADLPIFWKLLAPFLALLLIVGAGGAYILARDLTSQANAALADEVALRVLDARTTLHAAELDLLESVNYASNLQGMADGIRNRSSGDAERLLASVLALKDAVVMVAALDATGNTLAQLSRDSTDVAEADSDWHHVEPISRAVASHGTTKTSGLATIGSKTFLAVVAPVCLPAGEACDPVGYTAAFTDLRRAMAAEEGGSATTTLFDLDGRAVATDGQGSKPPPAISLQHPSEIRHVRRQMDGDEVVTGYAMFRLSGAPAGTIAVTLPWRSAIALAGPAAGRLLALVLSAMGAAVMVGVVVSRVILRQLRAVVKTSQALGTGDLARRAPVFSADEHGQLALSLNRMADQLQASRETLEMQVDQRTAEIRRLLHDRSDFFAGLSHELRTPLAVILTQADLISDNPEPDDIVEATGAISASATQLLDVVNDILAFAQAETGSLEMNLAAVSVREVFEEVEPMLARLGEAAGVDVTIDAGDSLPDVVGDRARVKEVITNLVDNAIKYTPAGGKVDVRARMRRGRLTVDVRDTGVGIPLEVGDRVFEPFYRVADSSPQRGQPSSGLGLALARIWVEAHGGTLRWRPRRGGGTIFTVTLSRV